MKYSALLRADWFGPLAIVLLASAVITAFAPAVLSPFHIQILRGVNFAIQAGEVRHQPWGGQTSVFAAVEL